MYPSGVTGYQDPLSLKAFFSHPSVSFSSSINLVAKVQIFIKLVMYVLSHGCLLSFYKVFFHLHTWFYLSCVWLKMSLWIFPCIPRCFHLLHDGTTNFHSCINTSFLTSFFLNWYSLSSWKVLHQWCHCIRHIIFHLELSLLVLRNKPHSSFLIADYVCDLSYKSNSFAWLETFHK